MTPDQALFKAAQLVMALTGHGPLFAHRVNLAWTICNRAQHLFHNQLQGQELAWPAAIQDEWDCVTTDPKVRKELTNVLKLTLADSPVLRDCFAAVCAACYNYEPDRTRAAMVALRKGTTRTPSKMLVGVTQTKLFEDTYFEYFGLHAVFNKQSV